MFLRLPSVHWIKCRNNNWTYFNNTCRSRAHILSLLRRGMIYRGEKRRLCVYPFEGFTDPAEIVACRLPGQSDCYLIFIDRTVSDIFLHLQWSYYNKENIFSLKKSPNKTIVRREAILFWILWKFVCLIMSHRAKYNAFYLGKTTFLVGIWLNCIILYLQSNII